MPRPGLYTIHGLGGLALKGIVYPKFQGKGFPTGDSNPASSLQGESLSTANSGNGIPQQKADVVTRMNIGGDDREALSWLGTPVFADILIKADANEDDSLGLYLDTVLITVSQEKHIVKTPVNGRNGTVKEYFSDGDFSITLEGAIVGRNQHAYPEGDVKNLVRLMKQPVSIVAISPFLQLFGIFDITIESYNIEQLEGFQNMQPFSIQCCSDLPIELIDVEDDF